MAGRVKNGYAIFNESDQSVYIFGGWDEKETQNTVWRYTTLPETLGKHDLEAGQMHFDGFLPKQVEGHACVYIPETQSVFIFGGFDSIGVTDRIMKYNLTTKAGSLVFG